VPGIESAGDVELSGAEIVVALENLNWSLKIVEDLDPPPIAANAAARGNAGGNE
jgi:hypothetical protein